MNKQKGVWKSFFRFYTRFHIPWHYFILTVALGVLASEIAVRLASYTIAVNKGELYNRVILGFCLLTVAHMIITSAVNILTTYGTATVSLRARNMVWRKILSLPQREVDKTAPSSLISCVTLDVDQASNSIYSLFTTVSSTYAVIRAIIIMARYSSTLTIWLVATIPVIVLLFFLVGRLQFYIMRRTYAAINTMTRFFSEHLSAMKHIKVQSLEDKEMEEGYKAIDARYKADLWAAILGQLQVMLHSLHVNIQTIVIAFGGSSLIRQGRMETTGITNFSAYTSTADQYIAEDLTHYQSFKGTQGALKFVNDLLQLPSEPRLEGQQPVPGDLVLENVRFSYDGEYEVLKGISLTVPQGSVTAIIGGNGCGKSTLIKLLQGFYTPSAGTILAGGQDITAVQPDAWRRSFGYVLQNSPLFSGTIRENILYGCRGKVNEEAVYEAARQADIHDFILSLPDGYDTEVGEMGGKLSGGQRQRVAMARALILHPAYLILDEAAASLDHKTGSRVFDSLMSAKTPEQTILLISHNMEEVDRADRIVSMRDGEVVGCGSAAEMRRSDPIYREYSANQRGGELA
ncbi:MAG: ABC transporter ATP-binding protein [Oscillospiraceae bacterium]|nr:ABC transporter ATP-binding protein [Oscillospiraceae bacterium]